MSKALVLRIGYLIAACATAAMGFAVSALTSLMDALAPDFEPMLDLRLLAGVPLLVGALLFVGLSVRPFWWGKMLCFWAGLSWIGFAAAMVAVRAGVGLPAFETILLLPIVCSAAMLA
ncbi:MAG TPA: hypothetical protein PLN53_13385, partial [Terricaulis sp.]|nr:hypothetical protein [Terricaulis sp.]